METKQQPPYPLRMPDKLRAQLEADAKLLGRSLNSEIVARLQASYGVKTLDNLKMFAKPASEPAGPTELAHSGLSRIAAEEYAAARLSQKKEMQEMIEAALRPYMSDFLASIERERAQWAAHAHTGVEPLDLTMEQARELIKKDRPR